MFYSPKHAQATKGSIARRRIAGVAVAGATAAVGSVATAQSASADNVWDAVAQCESGGNWSINTGNGFYGGLQFTHQTWQGFGGGQYANNADDATRSQQIEIAQNVLEVQGPGAWPVCSQEAGLTSSNGMVGGGGDSAPEQDDEDDDQEQVEEAPEQEEAPEPVEQEEAPEPVEQEEPEQEEAPEPVEQEAPEQDDDEDEERVSEAPSRSADRGFDFDLAVDGIRGPATTAAIEEWVGGSVDDNDKLSDNDIKKLQEKVGTAQDGIIGPKTTSALQELVGAETDGIWGPKTTTALQQHLNSL